MNAKLKELLKLGAAVGIGALGAKSPELAVLVQQFLNTLLQ